MSIRNSNFDTIRCISIIFVICIHSMGNLNPNIDIAILDINYITYLFLSSIIHMGVPLFVMLSGALLLEKNDEPIFFLKKRFKRIFIPFFIWSIIIFYLDKTTNNQSFLVIQSITEFFTKFLTNGVHGVYWYIYMLTGLYLFTPILQKVFKDISPTLLSYSIILIILLIIIQYIIPPNYDEKNLLLKYSFPYQIYLGYYIGGYYLNTHASKSKYFRKITIYGFIFFYLVGIVNRINPFTTFPIIFFQSLFFFGILISMKRGIFPSFKSSLVTFISKISYGIYLSHILFISLINKIGLLYNIPIFVTPFFLVISVLLLEIILFSIIQRIHLIKYLS